MLLYPGSKNALLPLLHVQSAAPARVCPTELYLVRRQLRGHIIHNQWSLSAAAAATSAAALPAPVPLLPINAGDAT